MKSFLTVVCLCFSLMASAQNVEKVGTVELGLPYEQALAAMKAGREDLFSNELSVLVRHVIRDGQFAEIYHPEDGRIYGGIQEGDGRYMEWHSCSWQTWSASALIAMALADTPAPEAPVRF